METIEALPVTPIGARDLDRCLALSAAAGWNQTADDWRMMIAGGAALGCRDGGGDLIASALALPFGDRIGWISMVLVASEWRRRGIATRLVERGVDWLESRARTALLDATPDGATVYRGMGFRTVARLTRWQRGGRGPGAAAGARSDDVVAAIPQSMLDLDWETFGADRAFVIRDMMLRGDALALAAPEPARGFVLTRRGRLATQVGPLAADREALATALLDAALARIEGPVFIDVFDHRAALVRHLQALGFTVQRPFERMVRGAADFGVPSARYFAVAGPELG